jgi:hypothetical protein
MASTATIPSEVTVSYTVRTNGQWHLACVPIPVAHPYVLARWHLGAKTIVNRSYFSANASFFTHWMPIADDPILDGQKGEL